MRYMTDDLRIKEIKELIPPAHLIRDLPCSQEASQAVHDARLAATEAGIDAGCLAQALTEAVYKADREAEQDEDIFGGIATAAIEAEPARRQAN